MQRTVDAALRKTLQSSDGTKALQLETVAGAAIRFFEKVRSARAPTVGPRRA